MGIWDDLIKKTHELIDEMESDSDESREQSFLEKIWEHRRELEDAKSNPQQDDETMSDLLDLFNRKIKGNDIESW